MGNFTLVCHGSYRCSHGDYQSAYTKLIWHKSWCLGRSTGCTASPCVVSTKCNLGSDFHSWASSSRKISMTAWLRATSFSGLMIEPLNWSRWESGYQKGVGMEITRLSSEDGTGLYQMVVWMEIPSRMARTRVSGTVVSFASGTKNLLMDEWGWYARTLTVITVWKVLTH